MNSIEIDAVATEDKLGRRKFAQQIVKSLSLFKGVKESFVVGISGKWGSGKSTLLSFLEHELNQAYNEDADKYRVIKFNPWANTVIETDELQRNLLESIVRILEGIRWKEDAEQANKKFKKYLKYLQYLKFVKYVHPVAEKITDILDDYIAQGSIHSLDEIRHTADTLIREKGIKLYILLDDLDRLSPDELTMVFKVIKLNINFLNTCFIIAYDKEVVIDALKKQYGTNAETYLEKIVQVDFSIPEILEEQVEDIFFSNLGQLYLMLNLKADEQVVYNIWRYHGLREYFRTLRDVNRYFNSLLFSLPNITSDINQGDFLTLEAIKVFDYSAYQKIYVDFLTIKRKAVWTESSFDSTTISQYPNIIAQSLLNYLFHKDRYINFLNNASEKRLSDPEFFARYYTLYIPSKDVTEETLEQFITIGNNRRQILFEIVKHKRVKNFLRRLSDRKLNKYYQVNDKGIFNVFVKFWDENEKEITPEVESYIWSSYFNLAHCFEDKFEGARAAIEELILHESQIQPMKYLFNHCIINYKDEGHYNPEIYGSVEDQINHLLAGLLDSFKKHMIQMNSHYFYMATRGGNKTITKSFIYSFAKFCPEEYKKSMTRYLPDSSFAIFIIKAKFLSFGESSEKPVLADFKNKELFFPGSMWNSFVASLEVTKKSAWNENDQKCVEFFLQEAKKNFNSQ